MEFNNPDDAMRAVASVLNSIENEQLVQAFQNILLQGEAIAKRECPVDQGPLRADIHSEMVETRDRLEGAIGNKLKYAPYVHNGTGIYAVNGDGRKTPWKYNVPIGKYKGWHLTKGQRPQPYLKKTLEKLKETFPDDIANAIRGGIR